MFDLFAHTNEVSGDGFFNHMMDGGHWSSDGGFAVFWMFIIMIVIAIGVVYLLTRFGNESNQAKKDDPLAIAKSRYAKGEITKKEFDEIKKNIS